ncbi:peptidoglycan-associated lipoprotein Pal [Psychrobacter sp. I-STPA6b]|uniref:peptidoglycan-associated lipoprotein Pal n=1 Tax=Psychrobacter sp. I-STPA6b TaxID=2585718 RepID=UPI001D0C345D|nr:peptidoglycan-associated lipoprotein Pal [Psychrobacter sp. I-STPA6b]
MQSIAKLTALSVLSAVLAITTGCATKRANTSEVVVAPMGIPGGSIYGSGSGLVSNSAVIVSGSEQLNSTVYFAFDSSALDTQARMILDQQAGFLNSNPSAQVLVAGYTDERGSREYNHALGERRAQSVKSYLTTQGVAASRIQTISYGEDDPAVPGHTEQDYALNRRAVLSY